MNKVITKIEQQKKNKKRFNIYINDEYSFSIHEDILVKFRLYKGSVLEGEIIDEILLEEETNRTWQKGLKFISYKPRTRKEVSTYLLKQGYNPEQVESVLDKLQAENWINDNHYAEQFIAQRLSSNPKGKKLIAFELRNRGIDQEIINKQIEVIDQEKELQLANKLIEKKYTQTKFEDWDTFQRKMSGFLQRRGFSYDVIYTILQNYKNTLN